MRTALLWSAGAVPGWLIAPKVNGDAETSSGLRRLAGGNDVPGSPRTAVAGGRQVSPFPCAGFGHNTKPMFTELRDGALDVGFIDTAAGTAERMLLFEINCYRTSFR